MGSADRDVTNADGSFHAQMDLRLQPSIKHTVWIVQDHRIRQMKVVIISKLVLLLGLFFHMHNWIARTFFSLDEERKHSCRTRSGCYLTILIGLRVCHTT